MNIVYVMGLLSLFLYQEKARQKSGGQGDETKIRAWRADHGPADRRMHPGNKGSCQGAGNR